MDNPPLLIGVIGGGRAGEPELAAAETLGRVLARRNATLVCGGLGGVMEAAARGAAQAGGAVVGILPGRDPGAANAWVTIPLATGLGEARNAVIASACRGLVAVGGEWGTLSEIALAKKMGKPVVALLPSRPLPEIPETTDPQQAADRLWAELELSPNETA